jgi:hypothetical protein
VKRSIGVWGAGLAILAAVAAVMILFTRAPVPGADAGAAVPAITAQEAKASTAPFSLWVSRDGAAARPVQAGEMLQTGDVLRFQTNFEEDAHLMIFKRDEKRRVLQLFPPEGTDASAAVAKGPQVLEGSVRLDDGSGVEDVLLIRSAAPFTAAQARDTFSAGKVAEGLSLEVVHIRRPPGK